MIHPAPTTQIDPTLARGVLTEVVQPTALRPGHIVVAFPNTSYEMHLIPTGPISTEPGKRIIGTIRLEARRVDAVTTGGRFVEPVYGRPRRVQGTVIATDDAAGTITVNAGMPVVAALTDARQRPSQFAPGVVVAFDAMEGATFTPSA